MRLLPVTVRGVITLVIIFVLIGCSSISLKKVEIHKQDGSVLKIESLEAFNVSELELIRILSE